MKIIKKIDFKWIEINFEYKEQIITLKFEPYRTINYIREKIKNKIMDLPENFHFFYLGRDLIESNLEKIGNIFKNREKVTIKLIIPSDDKINSYSPKKIFNYKYIDINHLLNNNTYKYKKIKNEEKKIQNIIMINKSQSELKIKLFQNKKIVEDNRNNLTKNKSESNLPTLKTINLNETNKNKIKLKKVNNNRIIRNSVDSLCNCGKNNISEYCRNCKKFICLKCRVEQKHKNHLIIRLDMLNIENNVKNYGKLIQDDIQKKIEMNKNIFHKNNFVGDNILLDRKERIIQKYQEVIKKYETMMSRIDNKLRSEDKERTSLIINAYNELSQKMNKQLFKLLDKLKNNYILKNKKILFNDLRSFFDDINSKEETLSFLGKDIIKYHLKNEINTKLKSSLDKIDRTLDEIDNEQIPFNLENKFSEELIKMEIIKHVKDNKELKNNRESFNLNTTKNEEILNKTLKNEEKDNNNKAVISKFVKNEIMLEKE